MDKVDLIKKIEVELSKGFNKRDIEYLSDIPINSLSTFLSGKRELSKKALIKVERFLDGDKPDPIGFKIPKKEKYITPQKQESKFSIFDKLGVNDSVEKSGSEPLTAYQAMLKKKRGF